MRSQVSPKLLDALHEKLPSNVAEAQYAELWGIDLRGTDERSIRLILQKVGTRATRADGGV